MTAVSNSKAPRIFLSSLKLAATNYALRCDAKYANPDIIEIDRRVRAAPYFELGEFLPMPFAKGVQPEYLDYPTEESVPVINTLSIQNLAIRIQDCRHVARDDYEALAPERQLKPNDVLLTVDGGVSIGKPALFAESGPFTVDSHVCALRPQGLTPLALVYLLVSPLGQMQFRRAESGASGQTTVTEDDIRRFVFPRSVLPTMDTVASAIESQRLRIAAERKRLDDDEAALWSGISALSM